MWLCWKEAQPKLADPLLLTFSETHSRCSFMPTLKLVLGQVDRGRANQSKFIDLLASLEHQLMAHSSVHAILLKSFAIISVNYTVEGWLEQKTSIMHTLMDLGTSTLFKIMKVNESVRWEKNKLHIRKCLKQKKHPCIFRWLLYYTIHLKKLTYMCSEPRYTQYYNLPLKDTPLQWRFGLLLWRVISSGLIAGKIKR